MIPRRPLTTRILEWWLPRDDRDEIIGDLDEQFVQRMASDGRARARRWYFGQVVDLLRRYQPGLGTPSPTPPGSRRIALIDDLRHVARRLRRHPAIAATVAAMLAAAIGISTGTFAVVDSLMLQRAPFHDAANLRAIAIQRFFGSGSPELINLMRAWRAVGTFEAVEASGVVALPGAAGSSTTAAALVSPGLFDLLGVRPIRGRAFTVDDTKGGGIEPVVIAERLWRQEFGGDDATIGGLIVINGSQYTLIGVMAADFGFPSLDTVMWRPISLDAAPFPAAASRYAYVRLPSGVPEPVVMEQATRIAGVADPRFTSRPNELWSSPIGGEIDAHAGRVLPLLAGAVGLIFLSLCANGSSLLLTQMSHRRRELGIRLSLGASRWRLRRECGIEYAAIGGVGVIAGIGLAHGIAAVAPQLLQSGFELQPSMNRIDIDPRALAIAGSLGFVAVLLAGLVPAWLGTRLAPAESIRPSERSPTESPPARRLRKALVIAQTAFAAMLLVGAALLVRSFERMATADRGMNARGLHSMPIFMSTVSPGILDDLEARVSALPGVQDVAVAGAAPPEAGGTSSSRWRTTSVTGVAIPMYIYEGRPDFFDFFGISLLKGRHFREDDDKNVTIVGERVAAMLWPNEDPLGKFMSNDDGPLQLQVVGVAREITLPSLFDRVDLPEIYLPYNGRRKLVTVSWRCATPCPERHELRSLIRDVDPKSEPLELRSAEQRYARELTRPRAAARLGAAFAGIGLATSCAGLFALMSYAIARRRREFGVRAALGATPAALRRGVAQEALSIAAIGTALGVLGAWALGRALASVIYGISLTDLPAWLAMIVVVTLTTLVASWRPARQAAGVDPILLLREE
jgi:predicted permease